MYPVPEGGLVSTPRFSVMLLNGVLHIAPSKFTPHTRTYALSHLSRMHKLLKVLQHRFPDVVGFALIEKRLNS